MGTCRVADPERSADGTEEFCLSFILPAAFLSASAVEICRQPPSDNSARPTGSPIIWFPGRFYKLGTICSYRGAGVVTVVPGFHVNNCWNKVSKRINCAWIFLSSCLRNQAARRCRGDKVNVLLELHTKTFKTFFFLFPHQLKNGDAQVASATLEPIWSYNM